LLRACDKIIVPKLAISSMLSNRKIIAMHARRYKTYAIDGVAPVIDPMAFVHPDAVLIGDVVVGAGCYVGPCASLRGDFSRIILEDGCNVQDNCTLHSMPGFALIIGRNGHIGHGAIIHSALVGANAMVGMNAVIMDCATIGESSIVAAMSFIKAGAKIPPKHLVAGVPARILRELTDDDLAMKIEGTRLYQQLARRSLASLVEVEPLTRFDPDRKRLEVDRPLPTRHHIMQKRSDKT
jgi:phenylacetic acid degradation protein